MEFRFVPVLARSRRSPIPVRVHGGLVPLRASGRSARRLVGADLERGARLCRHRGTARPRWRCRRFLDAIRAARRRRRQGEGAPRSLRLRSAPEVLRASRPRRRLPGCGGARRGLRLCAAPMRRQRPCRFRRAREVEGRRRGDDRACGRDRGRSRSSSDGLVRNAQMRLPSTSWLFRIRARAPLEVATVSGRPVGGNAATRQSGAELGRYRQEHGRAALDVRERDPLHRCVRAPAAGAEDDRRDEALGDQRRVRPEAAPTGSRAPA